jgi:hypothetical protein
MPRYRITWQDNLPVEYTVIVKVGAKKLSGQDKFDRIREVSRDFHKIFPQSKVSGQITRIEELEKK